jgi:hypothetical protein
MKSKKPRLVIADDDAGAGAGAGDVTTRSRKLSFDEPSSDDRVPPVQSTPSTPPVPSTPSSPPVPSHQ